MLDYISVLNFDLVCYFFFQTYGRAFHYFIIAVMSAPSFNSSMRPMDRPIETLEHKIVRNAVMTQTNLKPSYGDQAKDSANRTGITFSIEVILLLLSRFSISMNKNMIIVYGKRGYCRCTRI